jgi:predicted PurR-regulated permease PerM
MIAVTILTFAGLWALGVPAALGLALIAGLLDFIPFVGPIIAAVPAILLAFLQGPTVALWTLALYLLVQQLQGNLLQPLVQRYAVDVPPAVLLFAVAALTLETGLLVGVIVVTAALVGATGVSRAGLAAVVALFGGYFYLRFAALGVGAPTLLERSSGYGFGVLDPPQLIERFGDNPLPFYLYNIVASAVSVLFSEPISGVYRTTSAVVSGQLVPAMVVRVVASLGVVALLTTFAWHRRREWRARRFDRDDRLVLLFAAVLAANAVISYPYTKDVVMSPAGAFLAVAVFAAGRRMLARLPARLPAGVTAALIAAAVVTGSAWGLRILALHHELRQAAVVARIDWAYVESDIADGVVPVNGPGGAALLTQLRHDALVARPAPPPLDLPLRELLGD